MHFSGESIIFLEREPLVRPHLEYLGRIFNSSSLEGLQQTGRRMCPRKEEGLENVTVETRAPLPRKGSLELQQMVTTSQPQKGCHS